MSKPYRLSTGGRLIDRTKRIHFSFDGKQLSGFAGDTVASAVLRKRTAGFRPQFQVSPPARCHRPRLGGNECADWRGRRLAPRAQPSRHAG